MSLSRIWHLTSGSHLWNFILWLLQIFFPFQLFKNGTECVPTDVILEREEWTFITLFHFWKLSLLIRDSQYKNYPLVSSQWAPKLITYLWLVLNSSLIHLWSILDSSLYFMISGLCKRKYAHCIVIVVICDVGMYWSSTLS